MTDTSRAKEQGLTGRLLVVDDEEKNRSLLKDLFEVHGYEVELACDGEECLEKVIGFRPHVILLDVMMPKLDGFEVCKRLKADDSTSSIPVLMVTSLSERDDRLKGMEAQANDFITKPIDSAEVRLRVRNALQLKHLHDRVQDDLDRLKALEGLRDGLVRMMVHDMKNPLFGVSAYLELLQINAKDRLNDEEKEFVDEAMASSRELLAMIRSLLDISRIEEGKMPVSKSECDLCEIVAESLKSLAAVTGNKKMVFKESGPVMVTADRDLTRRIIVNLVSNAIKFTPDGKKVAIEVSEDPQGTKLSVIDEGYGIPPEFQKTVFDKFGRVEQKREGKMFSTGLGLTFCKLAVEAQGGTIGLESEEGTGSTFWFVLPDENGAG